ncbi:LuxR C-terminal-related transcriptional regulator [Slackia piriformis]
MANNGTSPLPKSWPIPNEAVLGYALYLVINATSLWGGVFPFFPADFHTEQTTFAFEITQSISFLAAFLATAIGAYRYPQFLRRSLIVAGGVPLSVGAFCLIAALYLPVFKMAFVVAGGILLGVGGAGFSFAWQRYFAAEEPEAGNFYLLSGALIAPVIFFCLYVVPIAVRVYLVPLIMVPLCGLCAVLSTRRIDFSQSQFEDVPREHPRVYLRVIQDHWRSALAVGALGFASGMVRAGAISDISMGDATNIASMIGTGVAAGLMLGLWMHRTYAIDSERVFLVLFPIAAICLLAFPLVPANHLFVMAGIVYMIFTFAFTVMLLQCAQISRDRGVNQGFVFGFFGSIVYTFQNVGFIFGYASHMALPVSVDDSFATALAGTFVLALALYFVRGGARTNDVSASVFRPDDVEFRAMKSAAQNPPESRKDAEPDETSTSAVKPARKNAEIQEKPDQQSLPLERSVEPLLDEPSHGDAPKARDRISLRCKELQERYRLTNRETEIMEAIVRGNSVARIAEIFFISENTVRTHSKHIYRKLDVHRRQDIIDMIDKMC